LNRQDNSLLENVWGEERLKNLNIGHPTQGIKGKNALLPLLFYIAHKTNVHLHTTNIHMYTHIYIELIGYIRICNAR
jgi:hypothetical protein